MVIVPASQRMAALEQRFGNPFAPGNPLGFDAVLDADDRADAFAAGEAALAGFGMNAELVPSALGGRFTRLDDLINVARVVTRRDPGLGAGYVTSSLLAAVCVWLAGNDDQRRYTADTLLAGHRLACAYHELDHGNDFAAVDFRARPDGHRLVLDGRKEVVTNVTRAHAVVTFAATGEPGTPRSHSQLLLRHPDLAHDRVTRLPRYSSVGLRGIHLGGIAFDSVPVDADRVLGGLGRGAENTMKAFQLSRIALPGMMTPALDTALRLAVQHLKGRTLYGAPAIGFPHLRMALVDVFVTLLTADAFTTAAARTLHLHPGEGALQAAAVKYVVPDLLMRAMDRLATVLGAHSYLAEGPTAVFQKLLRDIRAIGVVHVSKAACRMTILPQLPLVARRPVGPADPAVFVRDADLPPLDFRALRVTGNGRDHLFGGLRVAAEVLGGEHDAETRLISRMAGALAEEGHRRRAQCAALPTTELGVDASAPTARLVDRYVQLSVVGTCLETWRHNHDSGADWMPAWTAAVLARAEGCRGPLPPHVEDRLFAELLARCTDDRDLGLSGHHVFGHRVPEPRRALPGTR
ncbi:acyl-CoA dehydrogenase family protein [Streptomyces sp. NBC_01092]|uniref:acyl-CoA dehydrogenase family protein n=1 Tax=Streptomyces sp. NBC_01092 TaxID=2903748 RepID=UPI003863A4CF|nr:acyl-CoA/acyl-ACP dehydrogenase [Streptomyces sp. NBC_01092]